MTAVRLVLRMATGLALVWPVAGYPLALAALARISRRAVRKQPGYEPTVTIIVPTHNEAPLIRRRLLDVAGYDYDPSKIEVIVVDSGSTDGTAEIVEQARREGLLPGLKLIREETRRGKAAATNLALPEARGEIIVVTDALTLFDPRALRNIVANFADPAVGAVTGDFRVSEQATTSQQEEGLFWELRNRLRRLESAVDSTPFLSGEMCCYRRSLVQHVDEDSMADDMNVALRLRQSGYRAVVDGEASFSEARSASFRELDAVKSRRAVGGIQELMRFRRMVFNPRYGLFGMLILPSDLLYYLPLRLPALVWLALDCARGLGRRRTAFVSAVSLAAAAWGLARWPRLRRLSLVALFNEWIFLRGFVAWASGRYSVAWAQERSTRLAASEATERT
ncbi:MAG: glycosyltransferase [Dehalococcoidia bacterium]|nr:glycosyltransferase [Dehalococcoidia bacterium]